MQHGTSTAESARTAWLSKGKTWMRARIDNVLGYLARALQEARAHRSRSLASSLSCSQS